MNKEQFLAELNQYLQVIPVKERNELIEDYISHFEFGLQNGKSEEDLAKELGSPEEIAKEAIEEYERTKVHHGKKHNSSKTPRTIFTIIGLFLLNFVCAVVPILLSIWVTWLSLILAFLIATLSPLFAVVDYVYNSYFNIGTLFLSFVMCGISIFATFGLIYVGKQLKQLTLAYSNWNLKIIKGAE